MVHIVGALGLHIVVRFTIDKVVGTIFIVAFAASVFIGSASIAFTIALWAKIWTILILVLVIGLSSVFFYGKRGVSKNRLWVKALLFLGFWTFLGLSMRRADPSATRSSVLRPGP